MSQASDDGHPQKPNCCEDAPLSACAGPPITLLHAITLPTDPDEVLDRRHYAGHHQSPDDSPVRCPICAAVAEHMNNCRTCQARLIRCVRNGCRAAWNPFERLIAPIAANIARSMRGMTETFVDETREVAAFKGMQLVLQHPSCDPENVITDGRQLTGLLKTAMHRAVLTWVRDNDPTKETLPGLDEPTMETLLRLDDPNNTRDPLPSRRKSTRPGARQAVTERDDNPAVMLEQDQTVTALNQILVQYRATLDEPKQFVFDAWYAGQAGAHTPTQEQIARDMRQAMGADEKQYTISRWIGRFKDDLFALITAPDNGLAETTRERALRLFLDNKSRPRTRRATPVQPETPSPLRVDTNTNLGKTP